MNLDKSVRDALVVGLCQYEDLPMSDELTALARQAEEMAKLLETQGGFKVRRLPQDNQTREIDLDKQMVTQKELEAALRQLFNPESHDLPNTALFFFAGHGLPKKETHDGALATSDTNPDDDKWGLSLQWLGELLATSPIPQQIVWLESCYSGEFFQTVARIETSKLLEPDCCFITSARAHEEALADGLLTKYLLAFLRRLATVSISKYRATHRFNQ